jgi:hypothetical protein
MNPSEESYPKPVQGGDATHSLCFSEVTTRMKSLECKKRRKEILSEIVPSLESLSRKAGGEVDERPN